MGAAHPTVAPWGTQLVTDSGPLLVRITPGTSVRLEGHELARHAGLQEQVGPRGVPLPGELAGLVVRSSVQATVSVTASAWGRERLRVNRFASLACHAGSAVDLSAISRSGEVELWACAAVETKLRTVDELGAYTVPETGPARAVLLAASEAMEER